MNRSKTFYGGATFNEIDINQRQKKNHVELEYYKLKETQTSQTAQYPTNIYGVEIIKKEYWKESILIESKKINYIAQEETKAEQIIQTLQHNKVTPISLEDVITDLLKCP